jgi:drug/metabolite transporter (DMT)-like permease
VSATSTLLILAAVVCGVTGQVTLKVGMTRVGAIGADSLASPIQLVQRVFLQPLVISGLGCYVLGAVVWLAVLSRVPLSLAYPSLALSYVLTAFLAMMFLGEQVSGLRWAGIATICVGVVLISRS